MNETTKIEPQEINLQERAIETHLDDSLPAAQTLEAQNQATDVERSLTPRFIP